MISLFGLGLVRFPRGLVRLLSGLLLLVLYLWVFKSNWGWFVVSISLLASMQLRLLVFPPRPLVLFVLLLFELCGPLRCLLPMLLPFLTNLLDGPVGVDPAFHIIWSRFRMMRRYLAYCPDEEPRIFRMLDLISRGAQGHGPVHLLLIFAAELGVLGMGRRKVGFGFPTLP